jgi:hypothetical protein
MEVEEAADLVAEGVKGIKLSCYLINPKQR